MSEVTDPELLKQLNAPSHLDPDTNVEGGLKFGNEIDLLIGVSQGLLDPIEGLTQLAEKSTGWNLAPQSVKDWARNYRNKAQGTMLGMGGEVAGNLLPLAIPGGAAASALGAAGRVARVAPIAQRVAAGVAAGSMQPVSGGGDYWSTKVGQQILGAVGGAAGPKVAGMVARAAPAVAHAAAHAHGIPRIILNAMTLPVYPISSLARRAARIPGNAYGKVGGMVRGENPLPKQPEPEAAKSDGDKPATKGDRLYVTPSTGGE